MSEKCFICQKHSGEISVPGGAVYEDDLVFVGHRFPFPPGTPPENVYLGYFFVEPKRHVDSLADLTEAEAKQIGWITTRLGSALKTSEQAEHIYLFVLGQHGRHLHYHVVPRYQNTPRDYWGIHVDEWPDAPRGNGHDIEAVCTRIRNQM